MQLVFPVMNQRLLVLLIVLGIPLGMVGLSWYVQPAEQPAITAAPWVPTLEYAMRSTVVLRNPMGHGSGILIDASGTIMTARHVLDHGDDQIEAVLADGTHYPICDRWLSETADIGFCRIDPNSPTPYLSISAAPAQLGDSVWTIGAPLSHLMAGTLTKGIISNLGRDIEGDSYYQTDAAVAQGCSGGPLLDSNLDIIGIVTRCVISGGCYNAAVPLDAMLHSYWAYLGRNDGR